MEKKLKEERRREEKRETSMLHETNNCNSNIIKTMV
jgi:hypothetical protein